MKSVQRLDRIGSSLKRPAKCKPSTGGPVRFRNGYHFSRWCDLSFLIEQLELEQFGGRDVDILPPGSGTDENSIDELQATLFGEESRQCFGSAAFLDKAAFDQVGGAGELPESPGKLEVCEESFEVLRETLAQTGELLAELLQKLSHRTLAGLKIRGVTNHHQIRLDLMPARIGHLGCKVAHPMHPAASRADSSATSGRWSG